MEVQKDEGPPVQKESQPSPAVQLRKFSFGSHRKQGRQEQGSRTEDNRRFSLYNNPDGSSNKSSISSSASQPNSPEKSRGPVSLSRMGERLSLGSMLPQVGPLLN